MEREAWVSEPLGDGQTPRRRLRFLARIGLERDKEEANVTDPVRRPSVRVGLGHDTHRLVEGRPLILGGVRIDHPRGLAGHSDADAVLPAVTDALPGPPGAGGTG